MASVEEKVKEITSKVTKVPVEKIELENAFAADLGADSVQSVELVAMFEDAFGITLDEDEALNVDTVGGAIEYITKVCAEQDVKTE
ncbi:MAG: acyl carrier protein [Chitinivibrionales bacterium]|nr:acyl carrier protein [Chitinivibrionales bacterium]MBD3397108.1 acyl carrier protein [Chitinivibrionales bacterium]